MSTFIMVNTMEAVVPVTYHWAALELLHSYPNCSTKVTELLGERKGLFGV